MPIDICRWAVPGGSLACLQWLVAKGARLYERMMWLAVELGHVRMLTYIQEAAPEFAFESWLPSKAAGDGQLASLQWLIAEGCAYNGTELSGNAARGGCVAVMRWLTAELGVQFDQDALPCVARHGHIKAAQYLIQEHGCVVDQATWKAATEREPKLK